MPKSPVPQMWGPTPSTEPSRVEKLPHLLQLFGTNVNQVKVKATILYMQNQLDKTKISTIKGEKSLCDGVVFVPVFIEPKFLLTYTSRVWVLKIQ